ncbi:ABC transporter ATP-binding protein [Pseudaminobacter soli (ex Li et al. 2025)]|uniref:Peptide ABC transporter ATP-binding protein n=1 Tax=Pseudaminobacter soli (ex Li et al. 2025) TaxID=1295366 RepID=A0A2P7S1U0_9HYPH|nr:ABC transporter ATP-binding protein [Mesorhizobium soli]PSJ56422.1 peptide ABC transporter ATP-binding protein [Mesorhizobium soli]
MTAQTILQVDKLSIALRLKGQGFPAVSNLSFSVERGEVFGLVGESGCGKSLCALTIAGLLRDPLHVTGGRIDFDGQDINRLSNRDMRRLRGNRVAMIFQEPMTSLNPLMTIGDQIGEMFELHENMSRRQARLKAVESLEQVQVPSPERRIRDYPHQLSGGMRQRVMIAIALACNPALLIADEPTTALDVTIQAEIVELILDLCKARGTAVLMISHDLGLVARICNRVAVMYAGSIVEERAASEVFVDPRHPYTQGLLASLPRLGRRLQEGRKPLMEIKGVVPALTERGPGCGFAPRCSKATDICWADMPAATALSGSGKIRCYHHG